MHVHEMGECIIMAKKLKVKGIILHVSASTWGDIHVMRKWHTDPRPKGNGWSDVGYHGAALNGYRTYGDYRADQYNPDLDGKIELGRLHTVKGAHCLAKGMNSVTLGFCCIALPGWQSDRSIRDHKSNPDLQNISSNGLYWITERQLNAVLHACSVWCKKHNLDPTGKFWHTARQYWVLDQHSAYDPRKPIDASLNMHLIRAMVAARMSHIP